MTDREILDKYIDLDKIMPNGKRKERGDGNVV